jgi:hypothetical protein
MNNKISVVTNPNPNPTQPNHLHHESMGIKLTQRYIHIYRGNALQLTAMVGQLVKKNNYLY